MAAEVGRGTGRGKVEVKVEEEAEVELGVGVVEGVEVEGITQFKAQSKY